MIEDEVEGMIGGGTAGDGTCDGTTLGIGDEVGDGIVCMIEDEVEGIIGGGTAEGGTCGTTGGIEVGDKTTCVVAVLWITDGIDDMIVLGGGITGTTGVAGSSSMNTQQVEVTKYDIY